MLKLHKITRLIEIESPLSQTAANFKSNIVGRSMLRTLNHPVTTCWYMLSVVGSKLKNGQIFQASSVDVAWCCTHLARFMQHCVPLRTGWPKERSTCCAQHSCCIEMLELFGRACKYWANNKHLMTGPEGNSEFCFPRISMFPETKSRETLRFERNKIHCFPRNQSLSDLLYSKTKQKQILNNALRFQQERSTFRG